MKTGKTTLRKRLRIADTSGSAVALTIWGADCSKYAFKVGEVFALKKVMVREWNDIKSLNLGFRS